MARPSVHLHDRGVTGLAVFAKEAVSDGAVALTLVAPDGGRLGAGRPHLSAPGEGRIRQYSLCGDRWDPTTYRVGVKLNPAGRGGSRFVHEQLQVGDVVPFGGPRNTLRMHPAGSYLFLGVGIGSTPMLPMIDQAVRLGVPWRCVAFGRTRASMPFLDELLAHGENVELYETSVVGHRVLASCEQGLCGTCETDVVAGTPGHRDSVLAPHEHRAGDCLMVCVSRSLTPRLTVGL